MKLVGFLFLALCALASQVMADSEPPKQIKEPQIHAGAAGSPKDGFGVGVDIRKNVWYSDNGKHSFDISGGYSQHLGGPYGNGLASNHGGGIYTYRWR